MRRVALLLVPLLLLACDRQPVAPDIDVVPELKAASGWSEFPLEVDWVMYAECLDEDLHGTGTTDVRVQTVGTSQDSRTHYQVAMVEETWQLEGLTTGHIWRPVPGNHSTQMVSGSGDFLLVAERFVFQNQTTGQVLDWPTQIHFVMNALGEVKVDRWVLEECTLR